MQIDVVEAPPGGVEADVLVFAVRDPVELSGAAEGLDRLVEGRLTGLVEAGELRGDEGQVALLHSDGRLGAAASAPSALGRRTLDADRLRTAAAKVAARELDVGGDRRSPGSSRQDGLSAEEQGRAIVDGTLLGPYDNGRWKTNGERRRRDRAPRPLRPGARRAPPRRRAERERRGYLGQPLP